MRDSSPPLAGIPQEQLNASVHPLTLPQGLYMFWVRSGEPHRHEERGGLVLPAIHVGPGPGVPEDAIEFLSGREDRSRWLCGAGDILIARVVDKPVTFLLTSLIGAGIQPLDLEVDRLHARAEQRPAAPAQTAVPAPSPEGSPPRGLRTQVAAHISNRGDVTFIETDWAGRLGRGMSIEAFSILPLEGLASADIEYKGLTGAGFESPWLSNGALCGTRGMGIPLVGFAVRLRPNVAAQGYDCVYRGYFRSGATVGPMRNGEVCRSNTNGDPLEGIELRILETR